MTAMLQFEIDRERLKGYPEPLLRSKQSMDIVDADYVVHRLIHTALADTLRNGGTFVVVVGPTKLTVVQRQDAEDLT